VEETDSEKTLAFYGAELISDVKRFTIKALGPKVTEFFDS
jgi:hypothetical protein